MKKLINEVATLILFGIRICVEPSMESTVVNELKNLYKEQILGTIINHGSILVAVGSMEAQRQIEADLKKILTTQPIQDETYQSNKLAEAAETFLNKYSCVTGSFNETFYLANSLFMESMSMLKESCMFGRMREAFYISECMQNKVFQKHIAMGIVDLISIGMSMDESEFSGCSDVEIPLCLDQAERLGPCASCLDGAAYCLRGDYPIQIWKLKEPVRLKDEQDLIEWLDRVFDEFDMGISGFLILRLPNGEVFTVYGSKFDGWMYN